MGPMLLDTLLPKNKFSFYASSQGQVVLNFDRGYIYSILQVLIY